MKNVINIKLKLQSLMLLAFLILSTSCTKENVIEEDGLKETLEYSVDVKVYDINEQNFINAIISSRSQEALDEYLSQVKLTFEPDQKVPIDYKTIEPNSFEESPSADLKLREVLIELDDENIVSPYRIISSLKEGSTNIYKSGYAYSATYTSTKNGARVDWVYSNNTDPDVTWTFRWKNCRFCSYKGPLTSVLSSANTWDSYWVSSRRIKIKVHSNWHNYNHLFW